jgi:hypothetical protein
MGLRIGIQVKARFVGDEFGIMILYHLDHLHVEIF